MADNSIALITKFSTEGFDKVYAAESVSSVFKPNPAFIKFTGAKTLKIFKMSTGGLGNYTRNNVGDPRVNGATSDKMVGYPKRPAAGVWEERTIRMDRAAEYDIEYFDDEESGGLLVGNIATEVNRTQIIPEVDAYCFQEIYNNKGFEKKGNVAITTATGVKVPAPLKALNEGLTYEKKNQVPNANQVIFVSVDFENALRNSQELTKFVTQEDFDRNVKFSISKYEGRTLISVTPDRFATKFDFDQDGGYSRASDAKDIDFIVMPLDSAYHVVKFQKTRILTGNEALIMSHMDGYVMLARIYHDLFVLDNKKVAIYAHTGWFTDDTANGGLNLSADQVAMGYLPGTTTAIYAPQFSGAIYTNSGATKISDIVIVPAKDYGLVVSTAETVTTGTSTLGGTIGYDKVSIIHIGDAFSASTKYYLTDSRGVFVSQLKVYKPDGTEIAYVD